MDFELDFRIGFSSWIFELDFRVGFSSWIFELDFELDFRVGFSSWIFELDFRVGFRVGFSSWIFELDFELDFRVRISSWIFELGFFGGIFLAVFFWWVSNKFSVVLHNVLCQWCCTSSRGIFKMEEKEDCRSLRAILFNLS